MHYYDSGSREPLEALAAWLSQELTDEVAELRIQTGYFSADALGILVPILARASKLDLPTTFLIGSNDASSCGKDIEKLFLLLGMPRKNARLGIVSYNNGLFHPKTYHIKRGDDSQVAFVGSANLTRQGLVQNIEAAISVDTRDNDDVNQLTKIANVIDDWFDLPRLGLINIDSLEVISQLIEQGVLSAIRASHTNKGNLESGNGGVGIKLPNLCSMGKLPSLPTIFSTEEKDASDSEIVDVVYNPPIVYVPAALTFGMTLQNTDVGVGKTTKGASGRSPEVFIPIKALDLQPDFWGWQTQYLPGQNYVVDTAWSISHSAWLAVEMAKKNRKPRPLNKLDWHNVTISLNGQQHTATIWFNPDKKDIRIRESSLRSSGGIDDIMLIRQAPAGSQRDYDIEIVNKNDARYSAILARLTHSIRNSLKRIGYF